MAEPCFRWIPLCAAHELRRDFCDLLLAATPTGCFGDRLFELLGDEPLDALWSRNPPSVEGELRRRIAELRPLARGGVLVARSVLHQVEGELATTDGLGSAIRMVQFLLNRGGRNLPARRRRELERAKRLLQTRRAKQPR